MPPNQTSNFSKKILALSITNTVLIILLTIGIYFLWQDSHPSQTGGLLPKVGTSGIPGALGQKNASQSATQEGSSGDFKLSIEKKDNGVVANWDSSVKVSAVKVQNLSNQDKNIGGLLFAIGPIDPTKLVTSQTTDIIKTTFLPNPYQVGTVPAGFYNQNPSSSNIPKAEDIFKKGQVYSIQLFSYPDANTRKVAEYRLIY